MVHPASQNTSSFLQSPEWEEFQKSLGKKTWRVDGVLVIRHDLPGGLNYLYCPRPAGMTEKLLLEMGRVTKEEHSLFLKIDPLIEPKFKDLKSEVSDPIQPGKTVVIDLQKSAEELLRGMHEKTRYNIRLAERKSVEVSARGAGSVTHDIKSFWGLLRETAERDRFHTHPQSHYEKLLSVHSSDFSNEIFFAECKGKVIAAAIINFYKASATATYLHGASSREYRDIMAPHLLHWWITQEAKKRGFKHYDMWGIDEKRWPGVTRFKKGFGGRLVEYPDSLDIIYRKNLYWLYKLARKFL